MTHSETKKVALVTGSGRGIGRETALVFAKNNYSIAVNDLSQAEAESVGAEVRALGQEALISTHDISRHSAANELVAEIKARWGRVDVLVNNAGITRDAMLLKLSEEKWDQVIGVNLKGTFNMAQACARLMVAQNSGSIINLASVAALGNIGQINYSASKAGVIGMTRSLALELARNQINVNAIAPGLVDTDLVQKIPTEIREKLIQKIPLRRVARPVEIARLILFLASEDAAYITGQCIFMDGGLSVGI